MEFVQSASQARIKAQRSGFDSEKEEQGSEGSFRQKAKPGAGNGAERTLDHSPVNPKPEPSAQHGSGLEKEEQRNG